MSGPSKDALLQVHGLTVALPTGAGLRPVIEDVDLDVGAGECVAIVGESGAGKTQLARALVNLTAHGAQLRGRIVFRGAELDLTARDAWSGIRGAGIGLVFQDSLAALAPHRSVGRQLEDVLLAHGATSRAQARTAAQRWLDRVSMDHAARRLDQYPSELSGGLRQRAAIALALAARPALLIADEPTSALDPTLAVALLGLLQELKTDEGIGLLLISHDLAVVAGLADRVLTLYAGRVVEAARVDALYATPRHPYTACLLGRVASGIEATSAAIATSGCAYRTRCAVAGPECTLAPAPRHVGDARVRCHHPLGVSP